MFAAVGLSMPFMMKVMVWWYFVSDPRKIMTALIPVVFVWFDLNWHNSNLIVLFWSFLQSHQCTCCFWLSESNILVEENLCVNFCKWLWKFPGDSGDLVCPLFATSHTASGGIVLLSFGTLDTCLKCHTCGIELELLIDTAGDQHGPATQPDSFSDLEYLSNPN